MGKRYDIRYNHNRRYLKNILRNLVKWEGLPDTIDERAHNELVLFGGFDVGFRWSGTDIGSGKRYNNDIVVANGACAGIDLYGKPTDYTSANARITPSVHRKIGVDCAICYNTSNYIYGENFNTLVDIYADLLTEISLSERTSVRNSRVVLVPTVRDDTEAIRVSNLLEQIYEGDSHALAYEISELDGKNIFPVKARDNIVVAELADARRCVLADFFSEIGVKTLAVDKRERVNLAEMDSNSQQLHLSSEIIMQPRRYWAQEMNRIFGTNISVSFNEEIVKEALTNGIQPENETSMGGNDND